MIEFHCPICAKKIELKEDEKHIYHRPWAFHIAIDHGKLFGKEIPRSSARLWLSYPFLDPKLQKELREEFREKNKKGEMQVVLND